MPTTTDTTRTLSLTALVRQLESGEVTPAGIVRSCLDRVEALEPGIRAWVSVDVVGALAAAEALERVPLPVRGPLWGIPAGVKDIIDVAGTPSGCGSTVRHRALPAGDDAACVASLRRAGGVVLGKTVTTEYGYFAPGPTRNPHRPGHTPGGSSSGSAAAVAAGMVPFAFGTQTAGSLTRPAAYCGVAGFVASPGTVPTDGVTGLSHSFDSIGFLAAGVNDVRTAWTAIAGVDDEPRQVRAPRILLWDGSDVASISEGMQAGFQRVLAVLRPRGAWVESLGFSGAIRDLAQLHAVVMAYEAVRLREELDGRDAEISAPLAQLLARGRALPAVEYAQATAGIAAARLEVTARIRSFDAVLAPAAPGAAPAGLAATGDPVLSRPWQAMGLPVVTVPGLRDGDGLPLGLQLVGLPGNESRLFDVAAWLEPVLRTHAPAAPNQT
ncbi:amidase [Arthrobacter sp. I2-34]|uniref:Amidase n=1 Tax=Arthrobacter hankyongi TaxID=2904801 RepID=A0ABS9LAK1_9MICC|nr:amidase [Arthrobacter hankyongi]MCG2623695.1 amidase [Arthrobacter hankyongi]